MCIRDRCRAILGVMFGFWFAVWHGQVYHVWGRLFVPSVVARGGVVVLCTFCRRLRFCGLVQVCTGCVHQAVCLCEVVETPLTAKPCGTQVAGRICCLFYSFVLRIVIIAFCLPLQSSENHITRAILITSYFQAFLCRLIQTMLANSVFEMLSEGA